MVSLKNGVLKVINDSEGIARTIFDVCFVINMVVIFALYQVKFASPAAAFLLLASSFFIWVGRKKSKVIIPYNTAWYTAMIVYASLSSLWTSYIATDFISDILKMVVVLAIVTAVVIYVDKPEDLERIMSLFVISMIIIAFLEFTSVSPDKWFEGAMGSNFSACNPNEIAFWSACAEMICFYRFYIKKQRAYIILVFFFLMFVLMSSSRKAMIEALVVPLAIILLSTYKKNYFLKVLIMLAVIVAIIYFVMTNESAYQAIGQRIHSMMKYLETGTQRSDNSLYMRDYYRNIAKQMFSESPILGKGMGNYAKIIDFDMGWKNVYSHDNHWQILSEFGIVGFILYYSFYAYCIYKLAKDIIVNKSRISILYFSIMVMLVVLESGMVTYNIKTIHLVVSMAYASTYVGETDGRQYKFIENNVNKLEE